VLLLSLSAGMATAQHFTTPKDYAFNTKGDFAKYEPQIIQYTKYIEVASVSEQSEARHDANAFFLK
jgi:hypothetical protein